MSQIAEQPLLVPAGAFALPAAPAQLRAAAAAEAGARVEGSAAAAQGGAGAPLAVFAAVGASAVAAVRRRGQRAGAAKDRAATATCAFEDENGVQAPVGFWDPMGFTKDGDVEDFRRRRETELKHGRVSMFATIGYIVPEYFKLPGYLSPSGSLKFADVPNGLAAVGKVPVEGWLQWVALCGFYETCVNVPQDPSDPGNYGRGRLGITGESMTGDGRKRALSSELANGRLAMVAIMGMMFQNGFIGTTGPEMWMPASAGPKVLEGTGGPRADDFWDPAGLAKGKSDEQLIYWRAVELKHGRVSMLACLGWFHVAAGWHPIGDAAARVRVSDDPMIAATQLPIGGAFQVVFTIMCLEWMTTYVTTPVADKPWDILGWSPVLYDEEPDWKETQLKELNNGRLAMMGFIGLVSQEMLTGDYVAGIGQPGFGAWVQEPNWSPPY